MSRQSITRRGFLKGAAAGAGMVILKNPASARTFQANEKVNVALVGVTGRGDWFINEMPKMSRIVAFCDVNEWRTKELYAKHPDMPKFIDFRRMLDEKDKDIDGVVIATPDHTHAIIACQAMQHGKGVFIEKPMAHDPWEARQLREMATRYKVASIMGNQGTAFEPFRRCVELIQGNVLGDVRDAWAWNFSGGRNHQAKPTERPTLPSYLHWDLWLGPAAEREYHPYWLQWPGWREFGSGQLGMWATHTMNLAFKALRCDSLWFADPSPAAREKRLIRITARVPEINTLSFPAWEMIDFAFPARGDMPPFTIHWWNGDGIPDLRQKLGALWADIPGTGTTDRAGRGDGTPDWVGVTGNWLGASGTWLPGDKAQIHANAHNMSYSLHPQSTYKSFTGGPPRTLPRTSGPEKEWLDAIQGGRPPMSSFDYAGPFIELLQIGNIATQFNETLEFDPLEFKFTNNPKADALLKQPRRKGWEI